MKTIEDKFLETVGYGEEAKIICAFRPHMIAVVSFEGSSVCEVVQFCDSDFSFISLESDILERELIPFCIYRGSVDDCIKLFYFYKTLPFCGLRVV